MYNADVQLGSCRNMQKGKMKEFLICAILKESNVLGYNLGVQILGELERKISELQSEFSPSVHLTASLTVLQNLFLS